MYFSKKDEITDKGKKVKNIEKYCLNKNAGKDLYYREMQPITFAFI